jgi:predicted enzyme related to lactoylglutathione lyase
MATTATPATGIAANTGTKGRFVWHELMTTDPKAAQTFYKEVIGWKTSSMEGGEMPYDFWLTGDTPDTMIGGLMGMPPGASAMGAPPAWTAYVEVPDTDATVEQTVKAGGKVLMPAKTIEQAGRFAVLQDPQGAVFAILTSAKPLGPENDPQPLEFSWHELTTSDLPGAVKFYEQIFGWEKKSEFDMGEMGVYHMFGRDRFTYGGMMKKTPDGPGVYWLHYIRVDSADAATERAKKAGATLMVGPMEVPGEDRIAVLRDPQGAVFAVHSKKA